MEEALQEGAGAQVGVSGTHALHQTKQLLGIGTPAIALAALQAFALAFALTLLLAFPFALLFCGILLALFLPLLLAFAVLSEDEC